MDIEQIVGRLEQIKERLAESTFPSDAEVLETLEGLEQMLVTAYEHHRHYVAWVTRRGKSNDQPS